MIATRRAAFALLAGGLVAASVPALAETIVIRERAMPELKVEVMGAPPHPGWHWVKGHWRWADRRGEWVWAPGHWVATAVPDMPAVIVETPPPPPSPRHYWVRGHWAWEGNHWQWFHGHWVG
jgi:hypothetical protein